MKCYSEVVLETSVSYDKFINVLSQWMLECKRQKRSGLNEEERVIANFVEIWRKKKPGEPAENEIREKKTKNFLAI